jgi:hypothetical protein
MRKKKIGATTLLGRVATALTQIRKKMIQLFDFNALPKLQQVTNLKSTTQMQQKKNYPRTYRRHKGAWGSKI